MPQVADRSIESISLSEGWLDCLRLLEQIPERKVVHLLVRISNPTKHIEAIKQQAQLVIDEINAGRAERGRMYDVETTRNTIFPVRWAARFPQPKELGDYYRQRYTKGQGLRGFRHNSQGTYFGRIVAYPRADGTTGDQLADTVRKLRDELKGGRPKSSRYEINIYSEALDKNPMSFPCLAHLAMHLHMGKLHLQAIYRNEHLIARGYGNFWGLADLQAYVAAAAGVEVGELLMTIGHAELDGNIRPVRELLSKFPPED